MFKSKVQRKAMLIGLAVGVAASAFLPARWNPAVIVNGFLSR